MVEKLLFQNSIKKSHEPLQPEVEWDILNLLVGFSNLLSFRTTVGTDVTLVLTTFVLYITLIYPPTCQADKF